MPRSLTIEIPDDDYQQLQRWAAERGRTPEALAGEWFAEQLHIVLNDPLLRWAGAVDSDVTDVGERHDHYIGEALARDLRGEPDA
jgi:hypothetical protein